MEPKRLIELAKMAIQTAHEAYDLYKQLFKENKSTDFTKQTVIVFGEFKKQMMDGIDGYRKAPKQFLEWCDLISPLLALYKDNKIEDGSTQKDVLINVLENGKTIMTDAQNGFRQCAERFNEAGGEFTTLENRIANEFYENGDQLQSRTSKKLVADLLEKLASVREFFENFACKKNKITIAYRSIGDVKVHTENTKTYVLIDDFPELQKSVNLAADSIITKCNEYRKKYA